VHALLVFYIHQVVASFHIGDPFKLVVRDLIFPLKKPFQHGLMLSFLKGEFFKGLFRSGIGLLSTGGFIKRDGVLFFFKGKIDEIFKRFEIYDCNPPW
jgi:hypothetical protein